MRNVIWKARYGGGFEGGAWCAIHGTQIPPDAIGDESQCVSFFERYRKVVGIGDTPEKALDDLQRKVVGCSHVWAYAPVMNDWATESALAEENRQLRFLLKRERESTCKRADALRKANADLEAENQRLHDVNAEQENRKLKAEIAEKRLLIDYLYHTLHLRGENNEQLNRLVAELRERVTKLDAENKRLQAIVEASKGEQEGGDA